MNFDLNMIPTTFDMLHAGLSASSLLLLLIAVSRKSKEVQLACQLTEVGTLKIECVSVENEKNRWQLEFEVRKHSESDSEIQRHPRLSEAISLITHLYSGNKKASDNQTIKTLGKDLDKLLGPRDE
jgi:hypothetical protein